MAGAGDRPGSERSGSGRAAALARLLHRDCTRLLELYKEKEEIPPGLNTEMDRIVPISPSTPGLSANERVWLLHSALGQCLVLLKCVIDKEKEVFGGVGEGEYERMQNTVRDRLGHLLQGTKALLVDGEGTTTLTPDTRTKEKIDGLDKTDSFGLKVWTCKVLLELVHWTHSAIQTLKALSLVREKEPGRITRKMKRGRRGRREKGEQKI